MVTASQAFHDAVRDGKPQRALFLFDDYVFTNDDITGAVNFEEYFCGETDLTVGLTPSASISFTLINDAGALNGFTGGEFRAWIGACVSESVFKKKNKETCRVVTDAGNAITGHTAAPYLRYNGEACSAQPNFPVHALIWRDSTLYAIGRNGTHVTAWTVSLPDLPSELSPWRQVAGKIASWRALRTNYLYGNEKLVRAGAMLTAVAAADVPSGDFWTAKAKLWAARNVGIRLDTAGKKMTEWRDGAARVFEYVPLGVFTALRPARVKVRQIAVEGFDRMALFERELGSGFTPNQTASLTQQVSAVCSLVGATWAGGLPINASMTPYAVPGTNGMTAKEYLSELAEAAGSVARFDREGVLRFDWLTESGLTFDENRYSAFAPAEYTTTKIEKLQVRNSEQDIGVIVSVPDAQTNETYILQQNAFLGRAADAERILARLTAIPEYTPATASLFTDWSLRAGDWVTLVQGGESFRAPVMRLTMRWTGSPKIDIEATGNEHRAEVSAINRQEYRTGYAIHEVENSLETFRSFIQSPEGAASIIEQSADSVHISASQIDLKGYTTINGFQIDNDGYLRATGGTIGGFTVSANAIQSNNSNIILNSNGTLTCKSGEIGGFTITESQIKSSGNSPSLILSSSGALTCKNGEIGGFTVSENSIRSNNSNIILESSGNATIGALSIQGAAATFDGTVYVKNLVQKNSETISGGWLTGGSVGNSQLGTDSVTAGKIKNGEVTSAKLDTSYATSATITNLTNGSTVAGTIRVTNLSATLFSLNGEQIKTRAFTLSSGTYKLCYVEESG